MNKAKYNNIEYKYSKILTLNLKNKLKVKENNLEDVYKNEHEKINIGSERLSYEDICNISLPDPTEDEYIVFEIEDKKKYLERLIEYSKDWSTTDEDYNETISKINIVKKEIKILENKYINLDNDLQPSVDININGLNIENFNIEKLLISNNDSFKEQKIYDIINNMKKSIEIYNGNIKQCINNNINDIHMKINLINNINKIQTMVGLFEKNYNDILKNIN